MPPPSSGGLAVAQILALLRHTDYDSQPPGSIIAAQLLSEASKLAFADRDRYVGDPDFVDVPATALLEPDYIAARADLIRRDKVMPQADPGQINTTSTLGWASQHQV